MTVRGGTHCQVGSLMSKSVPISACVALSTDCHSHLVFPFFRKIKRLGNVSNIFQKNFDIEFLNIFGMISLDTLQPVDDTETSASRCWCEVTAGHSVWTTLVRMLTAARARGGGVSVDA